MRVISSHRCMSVAVGIGALVVPAWAGPSAGAVEEPAFTLTRSLPLFGRAHRLNADYSGDGTNELIVWEGPPNVQHLIDGRTGATLRTWTGQYSLGATVALLPDADGDARQEFLFTVPQQRVFAVSSQSPGGDVFSSTTRWQLSGPGSTVGLGEHLAVTAGSQPRALIGFGSGGRVVVCDPSSGAVTARISRDPATLDQSSFGTMVADAGDLNLDGVHDFAVGAPGRYSGSGWSYEGRIYYIDGRTTTGSGADVSVVHLPAGSVLGMTRVRDMGSFGLQLDNSCVFLGDPRPNNGLHETLMLAGTPYASYDLGGAIAVVLTLQPDGTVSSQVVASWINDTPARLNFGSSIHQIGDINGDGVLDAAMLEGSDGSLANRGRVLIVSGAGLLDGFSSTDLLQQLTATSYTFNTLEFLGDYDRNGSVDLAVGTSVLAEGIQIYSCVPAPVPEPACLAALAASLLLRRRRN